MKILFAMLHPGYMRYYYTTIKALAERGHTIHLAFDIPSKQAKDRLPERLQEDFSGQIMVHETPKIKGDWEALSRSVAWGMDYVRYLTPKFKNAHRLRKRVEVNIHPTFKWVMTEMPFFRTQKGIAFTLRLLKKTYHTIPSFTNVRKFIKKIKPDVVLVTPLVTQGSPQGEYVKAAKELGIVVAHCVASWDNLSSKGFIRGEPHRVILWNEIQKKEAVELHGIPADRVIVTGAQNFDEWFVREPSTTREEFCQKVGLDPEKPFMLYLCSSNFMAPNETRFVTRWIETIRGSKNPEISRLGILIRPYPEHVDQWKKVDLSVYDNVVLWPPEGEYPLTEEAKANFYDSIYHSMAVVGINTSAMIESAIVGRPVLTILAPELNESQRNTIHFHYMLKDNGGFLQVADNLEQHLEQLRIVIDEKEALLEQIRQFVNRFVRPHGLDKPCVPLVVKAIEELYTIKAERQRVSVGTIIFRLLLKPVARMVEKARNSESWKKKAKQWKQIVRQAEQMGVDPLQLYTMLERKEKER